MKAKILLLILVLMALPLRTLCSPLDGENPKFEYATEVSNSRPHAPMHFHAYVEEVNGVLQLSFLGNFSDVDIVITDADGSVVYQETNGTIYDGKVINITPADGYPYDVAITSSSINITGVIYLD